MVVIALGWKELSLESPPKMLYCGGDVDAAEKAVQKAGKDKSIALGQIFRGIEDRIIRRIVFE